MKFKHFQASRPRRSGISKWSLLGAVIAATIFATTACSSTPSSGATSANINQTDAVHVLNPAPHQMAQLNFLLGSYTCLQTLFGLKAQETTSKILDGNYYQMVVKAPIPQLGTVIAYWTFGWDPIDHNFVAQYFDNTGTTGVATSPGWRDGHLKFIGQNIAVTKAAGVSGYGEGAKIESLDDLIITGSGKFTDTSRYLKDGTWISGGASWCTKGS